MCHNTIKVSMLRHDGEQHRDGAGYDTSYIKIKSSQSLSYDFVGFFSIYFEMGENMNFIIRPVRMEDAIFINEMRRMDGVR